MDKYEYRVKTEQMLDHMEHRHYRKAMEIADVIDWHRVKNPVMLNNVSEIYEYNGEYQKSRDVLFIAYERAPGSRKTVYRLGTLALRLGDLEDASDCYEEFVKLAPKDPNQYILKYKLLKARKEPLADQIKALEDFKKAEYIEKWAYELACLYDQAGMTSECLEECDDLILWFSEGKYVYQAMELKMKYKPLTPLQQEKYDSQKGTDLNQVEYPSEAEPEEVQAQAAEEEEREAEKEAKRAAAAQAAAEAAAAKEAAMELPEVEAEPEQPEESVEDIVSRTMAAVHEVTLSEETESQPEAVAEEPETVAEPEASEEPEAGEEPETAPAAPEKEEPEAAPEDHAAAEPEQAEAAEEKTKAPEKAPEAKEITEEPEEAHHRRRHKKPGFRRTVKGANLEEALRNGVAVANGQEPGKKALNQKDEDLRITGQMKIEEILQEWEAKQKDHAQAIADQKKRDEEILAEKRREAERRREEEARRIEEQQRAAEEARRIAEQKAAEEARRQAARRAEEERLLAEQKAEEERRRAILKAEEEQRMLERQAAEKAARELEETRRKKAEEEAAKEAEEEPEEDYEEAELIEEEDYEEAELIEEEDFDEAELEAEEASEEADAAEDSTEPADAAVPEELFEEEPEPEADIPEPEEPEFTEEEFEEEDFGEDLFEDIAEPEEEKDEIDADLDELIRRLEAEQVEQTKKPEPEDLSLDGFEEDAFDEEAEEPAVELNVPEAAEAEEKPEAIELEEAFDEEDLDSFEEDFDGDFDDDFEEEPEEPEEEAEEEPAAEPQLSLDEEELTIEEPSEEEIQKRIRKGKGGVPFDTGFVVTGRYDLSATSEIGLRAGLTEEQKKLFSYFVPVRGMSEQIVEVLDNDRREKREGTSRTGNILVIGQKGSGKTVLAVDIVKAIQKQRNLKQGKVAIVTGESLNKKELGGIVQKLRGGAIIIEKAGKLNTRTVRELNRLMEKKTGELLVVLEDQRKPLEKLFTANPAFRRKFTSRLELPVFINDELVTFGQTYAKENGYKLDEMGILALYSRIDIMQREDHAVTVAEVKEIMDEAIDHSQKANVKHFARRVFGKGTDDRDRIILKEDDFRI